MVTRISKYEGLFAELLMQHISGIEPPGEDGNNAVMKGVVTALSFIAFGSVPLLFFVVTRPGDQLWMPQSALGASTVASALTMFLLGALSGTFTEQSKARSGMVMVGQGLLAAYAAYFLGQAMEDYQIVPGSAAAAAAAEL